MHYQLFKSDFVYYVLFIHIHRSCADHIFSLTSIIRNQKNKLTFMAYIDLEKTFDRIDRLLLYYKLRSLGFVGKMYDSIKSLYSS